MANNTGIKYGGRTKGTPNKLTNEVRIKLKELLFTELEYLPNLLDKLSEKERLIFIIKLMPFILPRVNNVSHLVDEPIEFFK